MRRYLTGPLLLNALLYGGAAALIVSFAYAAIYGPHGISARMALEKEVLVQTEELATLTSERAALQNRVHRLSADYLDLDLLDEQARKRLVLIRPDEQILR
ncbi:MAG: septum formation initiator family protein [Pseudomonadota bacterium]